MTRAFNDNLQMRWKRHSMCKIVQYCAYQCWANFKFLSKYITVIFFFNCHPKKCKHRVRPGAVWEVLLKFETWATPDQFFLFLTDDSSVIACPTLEQRASLVQKKTPWTRPERSNYSDSSVPIQFLDKDLINRVSLSLYEAKKCLSWCPIIIGLHKITSSLIKY